MPRAGRRNVALSLYVTAQEMALLDAVRAAMAARTLEAVAHSRATLVVALIRQEADRLRQGGDLPYRQMDALAGAMRAVDDEPVPKKRLGRPPQLPAAQNGRRSR